MTSFTIDNLTFTCHGQTLDLYEELFGDDKDMLGDLSNIVKIFQDINKENIENIDYGSMILGKYKELRNIVLCLLVQTEIEKLDCLVTPDLIKKVKKTIPLSIYTHDKLLSGIINLMMPPAVNADDSKKK